MTSIKLFQPKFDWLWVFLSLIAFLLAVSLTSCSSEYRAINAIKRIGIDPISLVIVKDYPQYLTSDTVKIDTIINVPFEVKVPEFVYDTILKVSIINDCNDFQYYDKHISIKLFEGKLSYIIKSKLIKDSTKAHLMINKLVGLCPQKAVLNGLIKENINQVLKSNKISDKLNWWRKVAIIEVLIIFFLSIYYVLKAIIWIKTLPFKM